MKKKHINLDINITIQSLNSQGKVQKEEKVHNQVVDDGLDRVADLIADFSDTGFTYIGIGTDNTSETSTDTTLGAEFTRESVTPTDEGTGLIQYDHTFTVGTGVSEDIVEAGLFDQAGVTGSTMLNRATFSAFTLDADNPLRIIVNITVTTS